MTRHFIPALFFVCCVTGCSSRPETAQDTFKQYLRHVFLNQDEQAWELLLPEDRTELVTLQAKLKASGSTHTIEAHKTLLVRAIMNPYAIKSVTMLDPVEGQSAEDAMLEYAMVDGRKGVAHMVRRQDEWFLKILP